MRILLAIVAALGLAGQASAQTIKIGSKNFTEQFIVAELYAAALEAAGFKVERKINLGTTLVAASTVEKDVKGGLKTTANIEAAKKVGKLIAERAVAKGIKEVAFDRGGYKYHGRVKALADAAREGGLSF